MKSEYRVRCPGTGRGRGVVFLGAAAPRTTGRSVRSLPSRLVGSSLLPSLSLSLSSAAGADGRAWPCARASIGQVCYLCSCRRMRLPGVHHLMLWQCGLFLCVSGVSRLHPGCRGVRSKFLKPRHRSRPSLFPSSTPPFCPRGRMKLTKVSLRV